LAKCSCTCMVPKQAHKEIHGEARLRLPRLLLVAPNGFYESSGFQSQPGEETGLNDSVFFSVAPYSPVKVCIRFGVTYRHHLQGQIVSQNRMPASCLVYSSTLNLVAVCSSETSVMYRTTICHIPEHTTLRVNATRISIEKVL
jgi:hypothetical protein